MIASLQSRHCFSFLFSDAVFLQLQNQVSDSFRCNFKIHLSKLTKMGKVERPGFRFLFYFLEGFSHVCGVDRMGGGCGSDLEIRNFQK